MKEEVWDAPERDQSMPRRSVRSIRVMVSNQSSKTKSTSALVSVGCSFLASGFMASTLGCFPPWSRAAPQLWAASAGALRGPPRRAPSCALCQACCASEGAQTPPRHDIALNRLVPRACELGWR